MATGALNERVAQTIEGYLSLPVSPRFGVLVGGEWGSGKTYLIQEIVDSYLAKDRKALWISLYGLSATTQIDKLIFQQLHPVLGSKKLHFAGRILASVVSATIPLPVGGADLELTIPELDFESFGGAPSEHLIVFDDLERCAIPIGLVLGYINAFSELSGLKVIVIANEEQIQPPEAKQVFDSQREKVFGLTVKIKADFHAAVSKFLRELAPESLVKFLAGQLAGVEEVFRQAGHENLRGLRQSLILFQRVFIALPADARTNSQFMADLLALYLVLALENADARLQEETLDDVVGLGEVKRLLRSEEGSPSRGSLINKKYPWLAKSKLAQQTGQFWMELFLEGNVNAAALATLVSTHPAFIEARTPAWVRLWWYYKLPQTELDSVLQEVVRQLDAGELTNAYEVLHATGTVMDLIERGMVKDISVQDWLRTSKMAFERLSGMEAFARNGEEPLQFEGSFGYAGLAFPEHTKNYSKLRGFAEAVFQREVSRRNAAVSKRVKDHLRAGDIDSLTAELDLLGNRYRRFPVLAGLEVSDLESATQRLITIEQWRSLAIAIKNYLDRAHPIEAGEAKVMNAIRRYLNEARKAKRGSVIAEGMGILLKAITIHKAG